MASALSPSTPTELSSDRNSANGGGSSNSSGSSSVASRASFDSVSVSPMPRDSSPCDGSSGSVTVELESMHLKPPCHSNVAVAAPGATSSPQTFSFLRACMGSLSPSPSPDSSCYRCLDTGDEFYWCLAIGSMINPTSLALRKLAPLESYPAVLAGWRLVFRGDCGMASILPSDSPVLQLEPHRAVAPRDDFHGMLHRLNREQMMKLDVIESSYERLEVDVRMYDGRMQRATVYKMEERKLDPSKIDCLPSERYLDIISRGCHAFGVAPEYIAWLRSHACVHRKPPSEYRKIPIHALHQSGARNLNITAEELVKYDGSTIIPDEDIQEQAALLQQQALHGGIGACAAASAAAAAAAAATAAEAATVKTATAAPGSLAPASSSSSSSSLAPPAVSFAAGTAGASPSPSPSPSSSSASPSASPSSSPSPSVSPHPPRYHPLRIAVNKKVLEWVGDLTQPLLANTYEFMRFNFGGTDLTHSYTRVFFEPLYPIVDSYKDMSLEHRAMIEDIFYWKIFNEDVASREWKLVGFLSNEEQRNSQQAGRAKLRKNHRGSMDQSGGLQPVSFEASQSGEGELQMPENLFLSLSLEDHSGASSTCFAFCCAGAQPFHQQARALRYRTAAGAAGQKNAQNDLLAGGVGGVGSAEAQALAAARGGKKIHQTERKRRHSIGNVGLHACAATATAAHATSDASSSSSSSTAAHQCCGPAGTCSSSSCPSNVAAAAGNATRDAASSSSSSTAAAASSSAAPAASSSSSTAAAAAALVSPLPQVAMPRPFLTRPQRSASICTGMLAAWHTAQSLLSPTSASGIATGGDDGSSFAQSPRRRINSADARESVSALSSPMAGLGINVAAAAAAAALASPSSSSLAAAVPSWPLVGLESPYGEEQCLAAMPSPVGRFES